MRRWVWLAGMAAAGLLQMTGGAAAQEGRSIFSTLDTQGRTVTTGDDIGGDLSAVDLLTGDGRRVQVWGLSLAPGEEVQVDLRSDDFDAYLYVVGPGLNGGLADDDGGSGLNSRICFVPEEAGEYRAVAASLGGDTGSFSMSALLTGGTCGGVSTSNEADDLVGLPTDGRSLQVGDEVEGTLGGADRTFYGTPVQAWAVQGVAGDAFSVDLVSDDFDAWLTLLGPGLEEWLESDDDAGRCDSRISLTFPETGEYTLVVSVNGYGLGSFHLRASETPGPVDPGPCSPPSGGGGGYDDYSYIEGTLDEITMVGSVDLEGWVDGSLSGNDAYFRNRPLQGWTLEGMAGTRVALTLISDQFDPYLFFDGPGFSEPLSDDDSAGDRNSRICVELPQTGVYRVFVGPYSSADPGARYRLEATSRDAADLCGNQFEVSPDRVMEILEGLDTRGRTIGVEEEQQGTLSGDLFHPESGRPVQPWRLRAEPGTFLYVDVVTTLFDAYLYVLGGGLEDVLTADDAEGTLNPRLGFTMPASGEVLLLPSAFGDSGRGDFLLRVSTNPPPMESSDGGGAISGTGADASELEGISAPVGELAMGLEVQGYLNEGNDVISRGYAQAFTYEGSAGEHVVFELVSDEIDTYLYLVGPGIAGALADDDGLGDLDSRIELILPESGTYTVVATALTEGTTGPFRLRAFRVAR